MDPGDPAGIDDYCCPCDGLNAAVTEQEFALYIGRAGTALAGNWRQDVFRTQPAA